MKSYIIISLVLPLAIAQSVTDCPVCDINDYNPVCSSGKAYKSLCHLMRLKCLKKIEQTSQYYGKCTRNGNVINNENLSDVQQSNQEIQARVDIAKGNILENVRRLNEG